MLVYVIMSRTKENMCDVLGVFTMQEQARRHWGEYTAENPDAECWIETHDADVWLHETKNEYKIIHKSMVSKTTGIMSHVISFSGEPCPAGFVEEGQGWYTIRQALDTLDEEEGKAKNLQLLDAYLHEKKK